MPVANGFSWLFLQDLSGRLQEMLIFQVNVTNWWLIPQRLMPEILKQKA
jgi:hypothetical protein